MPTVTGSGKGSTYSAVWVGIDGYTSSTVEQIGTEEDVVNGKAEYSAWYEMYPQNSVTIAMTIKPGDDISASVNYVNSNEFSLSITDVTTDKTYTTTQTLDTDGPPRQRCFGTTFVSGVDRRSASSSRVLPLANFQTVTFTGASATIGGVTGPIDDSAWQAAKINMVSGSTTEASTSALADSGSTSSFTVGFGATTPPAPTPSNPSPTPTPTPPSPLPPSSTPTPAPNPTTSSNWSGYAVETATTTISSYAVTSVNGSWTVPTVSSTGNGYSAVWVGIDGYNSSTVEQIGTEQDASDGYSAWYEMYPNGSVPINMTIKPGDAISASVNYLVGSNQFSLLIKDVTEGESYTTTQTLASNGRFGGTSQAQRSSAEWIVERASSGNGVLPLANFGSVTFTGASATLVQGRGAAATTITGPIDAKWPSSWSAVAINIASGSTTEATTSVLTDSSAASPTSSFTVTYTAASSSGQGSGGGGGSGWGGWGSGWGGWGSGWGFGGSYGGLSGGFSWWGQPVLLTQVVVSASGVQADTLSGVAFQGGLGSAAGWAAGITESSASPFQSGVASASPATAAATDFAIGSMYGESAGQQTYGSLRSGQSTAGWFAAATNRMWTDPAFELVRL